MSPRPLAAAGECHERLAEAGLAGRQRAYSHRAYRPPGKQRHAGGGPGGEGGEEDEPADGGH